MKTFTAGILAGALLSALFFGVFAGGNYAGAQPGGDKGTKFVGIANGTTKSNTRAITEDGDVYELKRRTVMSEGGKTKSVYYWDKEINVLEDQAAYLKVKPAE